MVKVIQIFKKIAENKTHIIFYIRQILLKVVIDSITKTQFKSINCIVYNKPLK